MKALEELQKLIDELNAKSEGVEYSLDYHSRNEATSVGYAYRGYYLFTRVDEQPAPKPRDHNFSKYVDGELIGENYTQAKSHLEKLLSEIAS